MTRCQLTQHADRNENMVRIHQNSCSNASAAATAEPVSGYIRLQP